MSISQDDTTLYCTPTEVASYYPKVEEFDASTTPTRSKVVQFIEKWSSRFDRRTGQSFRANQVIDETHDHLNLYYWLSGHPIRLRKRNIITPLDSSKGDKLEVYDGNEWHDWVDDPDMQEGRDQEYWVDGPVGVVYIYNRAILRPHPKFRLTYRYGNPDVPHDVRDAVAARAAGDLIDTDYWSGNVPGNQTEGGNSVQDSVRRWEEQWQRVVRDYKKIQWV